MAQNFADVDTSTYYSIGNTLHVLGKSIKDAFVTMLASVATSVTDATFNVAAKIADCEKTNFALYDAIWKQVNTDVTACLKSYATDDKYVIENLTALFKTVCAVGLTPLNNVTLCIKSNGLTDSKSIMAASNCTVGALVTCFENVIKIYFES